MIFPLEILLEGRGRPTMIQRDKSLSSALKIMIENEFSQLPVVDRRGLLTGVLSETSITRAHFHTNGRVPLLDLPVHHAQDRPVTISRGEDVDVFAVLDILQSTYAVIVVEDRRPVGILTDYDTTHFFRDFSEDLVRVQDIEVTLRQVTDAVFPETASTQAALMSAFGPDRKEPRQPSRVYDRLNFRELVTLITDERNWPRFKGYLDPKSLFLNFMEQVNPIRNDLAHFRRRPNSLERDVVERARTWLKSRPELALSGEAVQRRVEDQAAISVKDKKAGKYQPLRGWLASRPHAESLIRVSFDDISQLVGDLPPTAFEHRSWWANDSVGHRQSRAWLEAGWRVEDVEFSLQEVVFRRGNTADQSPDT